MEQPTTDRASGKTINSESGASVDEFQDVTAKRSSLTQSNEGEMPRSETAPASDLQARQLKETSSSVYLYGASAGIFPSVHAAAYTAYLDQLLKDAGDPRDPIERMLVEQLAQAHHAIGRLYFKASNSETVDAAGVYLTAAARLMNEFRKSTLALKTYRTPTVAPHVTVMQNIAGEQNIAVIGRDPVPGFRPAFAALDGELGDTPGCDGHEEALRIA